MRIRQMGYKEYGISKGEEKILLKKCSLYKNRAILLECCEAVYPAIADQLYFSLRHGVSYDKLAFCDVVYISKQNFYGYRRKALCCFKDRLIELGLY